MLFQAGRTKNYPSKLKGEFSQFPNKYYQENSLLLRKTKFTGGQRRPRFIPTHVYHAYPIQLKWPNFSLYINTQTQ